jgi:hypothetical protein
MNYFWTGFEKRAIADAGKAVGKFSKGGKLPLPGMLTHVSSPSRLPGQGAVKATGKGNLNPIHQHTVGTPGVQT